MKLLEISSGSIFKPVSMTYADFCYLNGVSRLRDRLFVVEYDL